MKMLKKVLFVLLMIISIVASLYFWKMSMTYYLIISVTISVLFIIFSCIYLFTHRNSKSSYKSLINNIVHTYDSVLVECSELPSLKDKNIILVDKIEDLIDAQIEMRKSIYYKKFEDNTVFILIDNDEACINIVKENPNNKASFEDDIVSYMEMNKGNYINGAILEELDKTTIIKLNNLKEFKVSPVRKKNEEQEQKQDEEQNQEQQEEIEQKDEELIQEEKQEDAVIEPAQEEKMPEPTQEEKLPEPVQEEEIEIL